MTFADDKSKKRDGFVFCFEWGDELEDATDYEYRQMVKAILKYAFSGEETPFEDRYLRGLWHGIKSRLDYDKEKYEKTCERNRKNGKKGAEERWGKDSERHSSIASAISGMAKIADIEAEEEREVEEEREAEEERGVRNAHERATAPLSNHPSSVSEVMEYARIGGDVCSEEEAQRFIDYFSATAVNGIWMTMYGKPIADWHPSFDRSWRKGLREKRYQSNNRYFGNNMPQVTPPIPPEKQM